MKIARGAVVYGVALQQHASVKLDTPSDRAWFAFNCLPRSKRTGGLPSARPLEEKNGLSNGALKKFFNGAMPKADTLKHYVRVLQVSYEWLLEGVGPGPRLGDNKFIEMGSYLRLNDDSEQPHVEVLAAADGLASHSKKEIAAIRAALGPKSADRREAASPAEEAASKSSTIRKRR